MADMRQRNLPDVLEIRFIHRNTSTAVLTYAGFLYFLDGYIVLIVNQAVFPSVPAEQGTTIG